MNKKLIFVLFTIMIFMPTMVTPVNAQDISLNIIATSQSLAAIVKEISGTHNNVSYILPEGTDAHSYSMTIQDIQKLQQADLVIVADSEDLSLESQMLENTRGIPHLDLVNYTEYGANLISVPGFERNYHGYWLGIKNARAIAKAVYNTLIALDPTDASYYQSQLYDFENRLSKLGNMLNETAAQYHLTGKKAVAAVPGVAYILNDLGIETGVLLLKGPGQFASTQEITDIENGIKNGTYSIIACAEVLEHAKAGEISEQISQDTGIPVAYIKIFSFGDLEDYFALETYNTATIISIFRIAQNNVEQSHNELYYYMVIGILGITTFIELIIIMNYRREELD